MTEKNIKNIRKLLQSRCSMTRYTLLNGTKVVRGLRIEELNKYLTSSLAKPSSFPGVKIKQISYYAVLSLVDETLNRILIHVGRNNNSN